MSSKKFTIEYTKTGSFLLGSGEPVTPEEQNIVFRPCPRILYIMFECHGKNILDFLTPSFKTRKNVAWRKFCGGNL